MNVLGQCQPSKGFLGFLSSSCSDLPGPGSPKTAHSNLDFLCFSVHLDEAPLGPRARFRQTIRRIFSNALDVLSFIATFS